MSREARLRRPLERCIALVLGVLFALGLWIAAELAIYRLVPLPAEPYPSDIEQARPGGFEGLLTYDPRLFWRLRPGVSSLEEDHGGAPFTVTTNDLGLRDDAFPAATGDRVYRVLSLGDSNTFGHGVEAHQTYTRVLERLLDQARPDVAVEALNAGVVGYSSTQSLVLQRELLRRFRFDLVLVYSLGCDMLDGPRPDAEFVHSEPVAMALGLLHRSRVFRLARYHGRADQGRARRPEGARHRRATPDRYRDNLREMVYLSRDHGADALLVVPLPICDSQHCTRHVRTRTPLEREPVYQGVMREVAVETGTGLVDLPARVGDWGPRSSIYLDPTHPTPEGHARIGEVIAEAALPLIERRHPR